MKRPIRSRLLLAGLLAAWLCLLPVSSFADGSWSVGSRDVRISLNADGSADVVERITLSMQGGLNNVLFRIAQSDESPVEIQEIKIIKNDEWVSCAMLSAGQWDAQVFSGTYAIEELTAVKEVTVYGSFNARKSHFLLSYRIRNAVGSDGGSASFLRSVILPDDTSANRNVHVQISLPAPVEDAQAEWKTEGVFVSSCSRTEQGDFLYAVPDTVPGEYLNVSLRFPLSILDEDAIHPVAKPADPTPMPDTATLLKARERAAARAGAEAHAGNIRRKLANGARILCSLLIGLGLFLAILLHWQVDARRRAACRRIRTMTPEDIERMIPADPVQGAWLRAAGRSSARVLGTLLIRAGERGAGLDADTEDLEGTCPKDAGLKVRGVMAYCLDRRLGCRISMLMPAGAAMMTIGLVVSVLFVIWYGYILAAVGVLLLLETALLPDLGEEGWCRSLAVRRRAGSLAALSGAWAYACRRERAWVKSGGRERGELVRRGVDRLHELIARHEETDFV